MTRFFALVFILALVSCTEHPVIHPKLKLNQGDAFLAKLDVEMSNRTKVVIASLGSEKQQFEATFDWKVVTVLKGSEYIISSTFRSFELHTKTKAQFDDQIKLNVSDSMPRSIERVPLDTIVSHLAGQVFEFHLTQAGEVTQVKGADSAIFRAFRACYPETVADSVYKQDFFLVKSFCGNRAFADYVQQFFAAYQTPDGWQQGSSFDNQTEVKEEVETVDEELTFYSRNEWECEGNDSSGGIRMTCSGRYAAAPEKEQTEVGFKLNVKGNHQGIVIYDAATFMPRKAELKQNYKISLGMDNIIFNMSMGSFEVVRTIRFQLAPNR